MKLDAYLFVYMQHLLQTGYLSHIYSEDNNIDLNHFFTTSDAIHLQRDILMGIVKNHKLEQEYLNEINKILLTQDLALDTPDQYTPRENTSFEA